MPPHTNAVARAAAALAANPELKTIGQLMRAARCSSGIAQLAIAAQNRAAELLRQQLANGPKREEHVEAAGEAAEVSEHALIAAADALGITTRKGQRKLRANADSAAGKRESNDSASSAATGAGLQPVGKRARALVREQLKHGPRPGAQVEAAAQAAEIPKRALIVKVRTQRGQWWIPDRKALEPGHRLP